MNGMDLFRAMTNIDERFIDEAEHGHLPRALFSPWLRAACLCLVIFGLWRIAPLLTAGPGQSTLPTEDPFRTEGSPMVFVQVEEMTADGFVGTVTMLSGADRPEVGTKLYVVITADTLQLTPEGGSAPPQTDYTGCLVWVDFSQYDAQSASITAECLSIESEPTP